MPSQDLSKDACLSHIIALTWAVAALVRNAGPVLAAPLFWAAFARKDTASAEWAQSFAICINTQKMLHDVGSCQMAVAQTALANIELTWASEIETFAIDARLLSCLATLKIAAKRVCVEPSLQCLAYVLRASLFFG